MKIGVWGPRGRARKVVRGGGGSVRGHAGDVPGCPGGHSGHTCPQGRKRKKYDQRGEKTVGRRGRRITEECGYNDKKIR